MKFKNLSYLAVIEHYDEARTSNDIFISYLFGFTQKIIWFWSPEKNCNLGFPIGPKQIYLGI